MTFPVPRRVLIPLLALVLALALGVGVAQLVGDNGDTADNAAAGGPTVQGTVQPSVARIADRRVLAISLDGLNPTALTKLGKKKTPNLHRLLRQGASTLNARAQVEQTVTLPNHTSMITGRRIAADENGHGVTWNSDKAGTTVEKASGDPAISSVFSVVHDAGGSTALFSTKTKFSLFQRSWPGAVDREVIKEEQDDALVKAARRDLVQHGRAFTFLHLGLADQIGHAKKWLSPAYLRAVRHLDSLVGSVLTTIRDTPSLSNLVIVLTADHGGVPGTKNHKWKTRLADYRIPFLIWGPGVTSGDLYAMNADTRREPGTKRILFGGKQPIRNGEVANLSLDLLGLSAVPDTLWDSAQDLAWTD